MSTYTPIASVTLSSAQSSVTFSGIPQTYTDLVLVTDFAVDSAGTYEHYLQFNGDTGSNYSHTVLYGTGSAAGSARQSNTTAIYAGTWNSAIGTSDREVVTIQINNYSNTTTNKTTLARWNSASVEVGTGVGLWRNTAAISSITFKGYASAKYTAGSTFNLYGVANASITNVAKATGGDSVVTDGTYWYHVFRSSGTFTPTQALSCDMLVIAGGGGTSRASGGGGAGQVLAYTSQSLTATGYTVTVGAGGTASTTSGLSTPGGNGNSSQFGSLTAATAGNASAAYGSGPWPSGASSGSGNAGGSANGNGAGGGGGQGGTGGNSNDTTGGGAGGIGTSTYSAWGSATSTGQNVSGTYYYAGGGGGGYNSGGRAGGTGGSGGGGNGGGSDGLLAATAGSANTGGGAGGGSNNSPYGAAGGSGIVIVRYSAA